MREILFRGKRDDLADNNKWVYGAFVEQYHSSRVGGRVDAIFSSTKFKTSRYVIDPETVGQCTGLKDKNGVKIFEGDKIYIDGCYLGYILLKDGAFNLIEKSNQSGSNILNQARMNKMEIIGNIHDNPELLEVK